MSINRALQPQTGVRTIRPTRTIASADGKPTKHRFCVTKYTNQILQGRLTLLPPACTFFATKSMSWSLTPAAPTVAAAMFSGWPFRTIACWAKGISSSTSININRFSRGSSRPICVGVRGGNVRNQDLKMHVNGPKRLVLISCMGSSFVDECWQKKTRESTLWQCPYNLSVATRPVYTGV